MSSLLIDDVRANLEQETQEKLDKDGGGVIQPKLQLRPKLKTMRQAHPVLHHLLLLRHLRLYPNLSPVAKAV